MSDDGRVRIWDVVTGRETFTLQENTRAPLALSPNGDLIALASQDGTVRIWSVTTGQETLILMGHTARVRSMAFSPRGDRVASASEDGSVRTWDASTGAEMLALKGERVVSLAFSPEGDRLASASALGNVLLWDTTSGQEISAFTIKAPEAVVEFSADLKRLAVVSGLTVKIWNVTTGQETLTLRGHTARVWSVAFDPTGERLATASADGSIRVWDTSTGQAILVLKGHDGDFTSSDQDREVLGYMIGHDDLLQGRNTLGVLAVDFSADGKRLISAGWDRTIKVWDATRSQEAITLEGHGQNQAVQTLAFNPRSTS